MRPELVADPERGTGRGGTGGPLRVLLVTEATSAGVGRHVIDLARGLVAAGDEVQLFYSPMRIDAPFEASLHDSGFTRVHARAMRRGPHPSDVGVVRALRRFVSESGPFDVVHSHSSKGGSVARAAGGGSGAVQVYTPHCIYTMNPEASRAMRRVALFVERALAPRTDALIAVSPGEHEHLLSIGIAERRVRMIPNGVRPLDWQPRAALRAELGFQERDTVVGFIGRLSHQKDPALLVRAFARLAAARPHLRLCMVGDGPLEAEVRALAAASGVGNAIVQAGFRTAVASLPAFDVLALPSLYEGLPYVLLEALSAGLPIVAMPVGGTELLVDDGANGSLAAAHTPDAFAAALAPVVDDADLRRRFGARSLELAEEFGSARMVCATRALYGELIGARR